MISFNHGQLLKLDYESDYNAVRRFLICNPGFSRRHFVSYSNSRLNRLLDTPPEIIAKNTGKPRLSTNLDFPCMVKEIQSISDNYWKNPWLRRSNWFSGAYDNVTAKWQCPQCAGISFHSHAYSIGWFNKCTIHNVEITSHCPECGKKWPKISNLFSGNLCSTCGRKNLTSVVQKRKENTKDVEQIPYAIERVWRWKISAKNAISILFEDHGLLNKPSNCIDYNDPIYPGVLSSMDPKECELIGKISDTIPSLSYIEIPCSFDCDKSSENKGFEQKSYASVIEDELCILYGYLSQSKKSILSELDSTYFYYGIPYGFEVITLTQIIFFTIVFNQISKDNKKEPEEWIDKIYSKIRMPTPYFNHKPLAITNDTDKLYLSVPDKLSEWYIRTSIRNLFLYIFKTVSILKILNSDNLSAKYVRDEMGNEIGEWSQECVRFFLRRKGNNLVLLYEESPSWMEILNCPSVWDPPFPVPGYGYR